MFYRILTVTVVLLLSGPAGADTTGEQLDELATLSIEELMDVPVVSTAKKQVRLGDTSAAVYVITAEDIRRFGFKTVPEALRYVPGVNAARISAGTWAISVRGFNGRLANKLLVMINGRSVYTPLFSGVYWESIDVVMEDVERIEVIRGPGAAVWGANAVNGVVNIITKNASRTEGGLAVAGAGDVEQILGVARYGASLNDKSWIRGFAKYRHRASTVTPETGKDRQDDSSFFHAGFRLDLISEHAEDLFVEGTFSQALAGQVDKVFTGLDWPYAEVRVDDAVPRDIALLTRWQKVVSESSDLSLQVFADHHYLEYLAFDASVNRFDIDFHHRLATGPHDIVWGAGYRLIDGSFNGSFSADFSKHQTQDYLLSAFIQDDITLARDRLRLTLGSKFEYNTWTDFEVQPNVRLLWTPHNQHSVWGAVSRATRTPSIGEFIIRLTQEVLPPNTLAPDTPETWVRIDGDEDVVAEVLVAYELGYRLQPAKFLGLDLAAFYNDYDDLVSAAPDTPVPSVLDGQVYLDMSMPLHNGMLGDAWGGEAAVDIRPFSALRLRGAYSLLRYEEKLQDGHESDQPITTMGNSPQHQAHLWASVDLPAGVSLEAAWRYVDMLKEGEIPAYNELEVCLNWQLHRNWQVSLTGYNLLQDEHLEFQTRSIITSVPAAIQRSFAASVRWDF